MRRLKWLGVLMVALALVTAACSSDDDNGAGKNATDEEATDGEGAAEDDEEEAGDGTEEPFEIDNCTLLTGEEVSQLADKPLVDPTDSILGCGWNFEGDAIASFSIRALREDATVAEHAEELAPNNEVLEIEGVGDEAVGLMTEGEVNFLVARDGDLFIEMVMTFLDMPPDSPQFETAKQLAQTALDRLKDAA